MIIVTSLEKMDLIEINRIKETNTKKYQNNAH